MTSQTASVPGAGGGARALPNFLIIGAQKSGTRWLRQNLGLHRSVFTAEAELEFFNHHFDDGVDSYSECFVDGASSRARGEATPGYMFYVDGPAEIAERIALTLGSGVALVALLRDPIERARSSYVHHLRRGRIEPDIDPLEYITALDPVTDPLGIVSGGWYGASLQPFAERFDRLLIEFHDDIAHDAEALFIRVLEHIGIDDPWVPAGLTDVVFSGKGIVAKKHPDHAILSLSYGELLDVLGESYRRDADLLEDLAGRPVPWRHRLDSNIVSVGGDHA